MRATPSSTSWRFRPARRASPAVPLAEEHDPLHAQLAGEPATVRRDRGRVVADPVREVEACERARGAAARPGGDDAADPHPAQRFMNDGTSTSSSNGSEYRS